MTTLAFTNLRVLIDEDTHQIYTDLTRGSVDKAEDVPFTKMPDLFIAAACAGAHFNKYKEISKKRRDIFVADAFDSKIHIPILIALAYKRSKKLEDLSDPKLILNICQGWANGGIHIIQDQVYSGKGLRPLYRLVDFALEKEQ